jgi:tRNA dimethylallyltransferase
MKQLNNKLLVICGPTATGKTALGFKLAKLFNGEIVSADSRQIYKGMDIGTGKDLPVVQPTLSRLSLSLGRLSLVPYVINSIPIWLYDVVNPDEDFSVSLYQKNAQKVIEDIHARGKLPIIIGGTGLYISALLGNLDLINIPRNIILRQQLDQEPVTKLQQRLHIEDKKVWEMLNSSDRNNPRRLIRKIEIAIYGKQKKIKQINVLSKDRDILKIGLTAANSFLYNRIDSRVDSRVNQGIISEIKKLLNSGYHFDLPSMSALGYREWKQYFDQSSVIRDQSTVKKIIQQWKYDEHGYARRQLTWFRKQKDIAWFDISDDNFSAEVVRHVRSWYTKK